MEKAGENGVHEGIQIALDLIGEMHPHLNGIYLMPPFGHYDYAAEIIEKLNAA
jgi:hypothetical protein